MKRFFYILILCSLLTNCTDDKNEDSGNQEPQEDFVTDLSTVYDLNILTEIENNYNSLQFSGGNFTTINIPIALHLVYQNDASGQNLSSSQIQNTTNRLNNYFGNIAKLNFELCEVKVLNDSDIYNLNLNNSQNLINSLRNNHLDSDVLNIYIVNDIIETGTGTVAGFHSSNGTGDRESFVVMDINYYDNTTLIHEVGHFFYLYHTHGNVNCGYTTDGDYVSDTPFDTNLFGNCDAIRVDQFCNYTGNDGFSPDTSNIMSYSRESCKVGLSNGQLLRAGNVARNSSLRGYLQNNSCNNNLCDGFYDGPTLNPSGFPCCTYPNSYDIAPWANVNGGTQPFEYQLEGITNPNILLTFQTSTIFNITEPGQYAIVIKDANGCIATKGILFEQ